MPCILNIKSYEALRQDIAAAKLNGLDVFSFDEGGQLDDSSAECAPPAKKACKSLLAKGLTAVRKRILNCAFIILRAQVCFENPYPDSEERLLMTLKAWGLALETCRATHHYSKEDNAEITDKEEALIVIRVGQLRGEMKTKARLVVQKSYGFDSDPTSSEAIEANRKLVEALLEDSEGKPRFIFANLFAEAISEWGLMFGHPAISHLLRLVWFNNKDKSDGLFWSAYFKDDMVPMPAIAWSCTAICCAIQEYSEGTLEGVRFSEEGYEGIYRDFLKELQNWHSWSSEPGRADVVSQLCRDILKNMKSGLKLSKPGGSSRTSKKDGFMFTSADYEAMEEAFRHRSNGSSSGEALSHSAD
ncbi:hypothetical protein FISHEDRAFT_71386 [Fistulina hepatica ATCC 64428]|nr:hypothetical protein FISHEDRAFT_71386 [Fistulina hepatica ATCC 64428]